MPSEEFKDRFGRRMKIVEEGLNSLRPFYWPVLIIQSTFWTSLKIAGYFGFPKALFTVSVLLTGAGIVLGFVYYTYRWDIHNRMGQVNEEISSNFISPTTMINMEISADQSAKHLDLMSRIFLEKEYIDFDQAQEELLNTTKKSISKRKDGIPYHEY